MSSISLTILQREVNSAFNRIYCFSIVEKFNNNASEFSLLIFISKGIREKKVVLTKNNYNNFYLRFPMNEKNCMLINSYYLIIINKCKKVFAFIIINFRNKNYLNTDQFSKLKV